MHARNSLVVQEVQLFSRLSDFFTAVRVQQLDLLRANEMPESENRGLRRLIREGIARHEFGSHVQNGQGRAFVFADTKLMLMFTENDLITRDDVTEPLCACSAPQPVPHSDGGTT